MFVTLTNDSYVTTAQAGKLCKADHYYTWQGLQISKTDGYVVSFTVVFMAHCSTTEAR